jgi:hypothetical protein
VSGGVSQINLEARLIVFLNNFGRFCIFIF